ncbi:hypothetical protein [Desmospora profundinema]|uniref:Uncharacterized protein n=1 Tax=Desmospora profundinema TaxID=1571184 RepID=A0ABU1IS51_9BACL|nr:hypothetical protein [Desmospora profundinema]MDR6227377.1 hypothetical protein [Desmospora profundinema]
MLEAPKSPTKKLEYVVKRAWEDVEQPHLQPYVAKLKYEDRQCTLEMCLTAQEADIYQNARAEYDKALRTSSDQRMIQHLKSQRFICLHDHFTEQIRKFDSIRRDDPCALDRTIEYCQVQIQYAPVARRAFENDPFHPHMPEHPGYHCLIQILEEEEKVGEALYLAKLAWEEGWKGDWAGWMDHLANRARRTTSP